MEPQSPSPIDNYTPQKVEDEELPPDMQSQEQHFHSDSSSDDVPLRQRRPMRASSDSPHESSYDLRDRHQHDYPGTSLLSQRRAARAATLPKPAKAIAKSTSKAPKKPGPRPWASKPIKKNDMVAKLEVIHEIEQCWGKGFIRAYIPKCHRPLVKKGKSGKRPVYRDHETDPKKWLPSVLKAILSIAKLTSDKAWLRKAMNDVVRYRIKNTGMCVMTLGWECALTYPGNRKPQLVTTDFDVLEDMLVKDWDVAYSFDIRYKHLMVNPQGQQETDEDIDHILGVQSGEEGSGDEDDDEEDDGGKDGSSNKEDEDDVDDSDDDMGQGGLTGQYLHASGYTNSPQYSHPRYTPGPPEKKQKTKLDKSTKRGSQLPVRPQPPSRLDKIQQGYHHPHSYGPPLDPWGRPMPYYGREGYDYGGYGMSGYGNYGPPSDNDGRYPSQPPAGYVNSPGYPPRHAMTPAPSQPDTDRKRTHGSPIGSNKRMRGYAPSPFPMGRPYPYGYPSSFHNAAPEVKQESSDFDVCNERGMSVEGGAAPTTELGESSSAAALEAELRATELELKVARLRAKQAALQQSQ